MILAFLLAVAHVMIAYAMYAKSSLLACAGRILHGSASEPFGVVRSAFTAKYFNSALFYGLILAFSRAGSVGGIKFTPIVLCFFKSDSPSCVVSVLEEEANSNELTVIENEDEQGNSSYFESEMTTDSTTMTTLSESDPDSNQIFDLKTSLAICFLVGAVVSF